jgi:hypothetical protein
MKLATARFAVKFEQTQKSTWSSPDDGSYNLLPFLKKHMLRKHGYTSVFVCFQVTVNRSAKVGV